MSDVLFEIGFYRLSQAAWLEEFKTAVDPGIAAYRKEWLDERGEEPPREDVARRDALLRRSEGFDKPWEYNEVFGWLRLELDGPGVKGYAWRIARKRPRRESPRIFDYRNKVLEVRFRDETPDDATRILRGRVEALADRGEVFAGWHPDLEAFDTIAPLVDWHRILGSQQSAGDRL